MFLSNALFPKEICGKMGCEKRNGSDNLQREILMKWNKSWLGSLLMEENPPGNQYYEFKYPSPPKLVSFQNTHFSIIYSVGSKGMGVAARRGFSQERVLYQEDSQLQCTG